MVRQVSEEDKELLDVIQRTIGEGHTHAVVTTTMDGVGDVALLVGIMEEDGGIEMHPLAILITSDIRDRIVEPSTEN
jgi:ABC-type polar amino acid transport system ATPase subunit